MTYREVGSTHHQTLTLEEHPQLGLVAAGLDLRKNVVEPLGPEHTLALTGLTGSLPTEILREILETADEIQTANPGVWVRYGSGFLEAPNAEIVAMDVFVYSNSENGDRRPIAFRVNKQWISCAGPQPHSVRELLQVGQNWWTEYPVYHPEYPPYDYEIYKFEVSSFGTVVPGELFNSFIRIFDSPLPLTGKFVEGFIDENPARTSQTVSELLDYLSSIICGYGIDEGLEASPLAASQAYALASEIEGGHALPAIGAWGALEVLAERLDTLDPRLVIDALINQQELSDDMLELNNAFIQWAVLSGIISEIVDEPDKAREPLTITADHSSGFQAVLHIDFRGQITCSPDPTENFELYAKLNSHAAQLSWSPEESLPDTGVSGFQPYPDDHPELAVALALYVLKTLDHEAPLTKVSLSRGLPHPGSDRLAT